MYQTEDRDANRKIILKHILKKHSTEGEDWVYLAQDKTSGDFLCKWQYTYGFQTGQVISLIPERVLCTAKGLCFMGLVIAKKIQTITNKSNN
jgi:hypothetical protein